MTASIPPLEQLPQVLEAHPDQGISLYTREGRAAISFGGLARRVETAVQRADALGLRRSACVGLVSGNRLETLAIDLAALSCRWTLVHLPERTGVRGLKDVPIRLDALVLESGAEHGLDTSDWALAGDLEGCQVFVRRDTDPAPVDARLAQAPAVVFSSGTTGRSKAIIVDRQAVLPHAMRFFRALKAGARDRFLIFLPLSNYQQKLLVYGCVLSGTGFCLSDMTAVMAALKAYRPTLFLAPPVFYESACSLARAGGGEKDPRASLSRLYGGHIRLAYSGMAPLPDAVLSLHHAHGVPLYEAYGMTEFGPICANTPEASAPGSVGQPIPPGSIRISEDGEIIASAPRCLTAGYVAEADREDERRTYVDAMSIATGDIGKLDEQGFLYIQGRKKEIIVTSQGHKIHPGSIERQFHDIASVRHAVVLGDGKPYLGLLVIVEDGCNDVRDAVRQRIAQLNRGFCAAHPIKRIHICTDAFTSENGMLTANLKLSRTHIAARYEPELF